MASSYEHGSEHIRCIDEDVPLVAEQLLGSQEEFGRYVSNVKVNLPHKRRGCTLRLFRIPAVHVCGYSRSGVKSVGCWTAPC
jgi:hypothetical protein